MPSMVASIESKIWDRAIDPEWAELDPEAATAILQIRYKQADVDRMNHLSALAREGQLDSEQREELDSYNRVAHMLAMLQSRARRALNNRR